MAKEEAKKKTVVRSLEKLQTLLDNAKEEAIKFEEKGVGVAGKEVRSYLQDIRNRAKNIRDLVTEIKNARKAEKVEEKQKSKKKKK